MSRRIGRSRRIEARAPHRRFRSVHDVTQQSLGGDVRPMPGRFRQWLRKVPWRHVWILVLAVLLMVLALFGLFSRY